MNELSDLEQVCRRFGVLPWRRQLSALLEMVRQPPSKIASISHGVEALPGILVGINPFDYLVYLGEGDAHETAVNLIASRVRVQGVFAYLDTVVEGKPLTSLDQIKDFFEAPALDHELEGHARRAAKRHPSDWLKEDVPEYDSQDLADQTGEQRATYKTLRAGYVEQAAEAAVNKVKSAPMEFLQNISSPNNGEGHLLYLRLSRKYFSAEAYARSLLAVWHPRVFISGGLPPTDLLDTDGQRVGVAYDYAPK